MNVKVELQREIRGSLWEYHHAENDEQRARAHARMTAGLLIATRLGYTLDAERAVLA